MKDVVRRIEAVSVTLSILLLTAVLLNLGNNDINRHANAQPTTIQNPFPNNTETIAALENLLGDDQAVILNGTSISNPNNTLLDSININIKEDCMQLPNSKHMYCP